MVGGGGHKFHAFCGWVMDDANFTRFAGLLDFGLGYQKNSTRSPAGY